MGYVIDYAGSDTFEEVYKELLDLIDSKWDKNTIQVDILTLWGFESENDYWGEYDEWWWLEGIITNEMLADLAHQMKGEQS